MVYWKWSLKGMELSRGWLTAVPSRRPLPFFFLVSVGHSVHSLPRYPNNNEEDSHVMSQETRDWLRETWLSKRRRKGNYLPAAPNPQSNSSFPFLDCWIMAAAGQRDVKNGMTNGISLQKYSCRWPFHFQKMEVVWPGTCLSLRSVPGSTSFSLCPFLSSFLDLYSISDSKKRRGKEKDKGLCLFLNLGWNRYRFLTQMQDRSLISYPPTIHFPFLCSFLEMDVG